MDLCANYPFTYQNKRGDWTSNPGEALSVAYEMVLNGTEIGRGAHCVF